MTLDPTPYSFQVQVVTNDGIQYYETELTSIQLDQLPANQIVYWRVRSRNASGYGPWSALSRFWTNDQSYAEYIGFTDFFVVQNALGPLIPPDGAAAIWRGFPGISSPTDRQQEGDGHWIVTASKATRCAGDCGSYEDFVGRAMRMGWIHVVPYDFEIRLTANGSLYYDRFDSHIVVPGETLPFEIWNIGIDTPDDPSDDFRMIPAALDLYYDGWGITQKDHNVSDNDDDPQTDAFYWFNPADTSPGTAGYDAWATDALAGGDPGGALLGPEVMSRFVFVNIDGGDVSTGLYNQEFPEEGTVFRLETTDAPPAPLLAAPGYESQVSAGEIAFYWNGASIDEFRIQISDQADFSGAIDVPNVEPGFVASLDRNGSYYWRVQRAERDWSDTWTFEVVGGITRVNTDVTADLPLRYELFANYPNPFNSSTVIAFNLPNASHVRLVLIRNHPSLGLRVRYYDPKPI